jgi:hypothetical protein
VRRHHDLISGPNARGAQQQGQRRGARGDADAVGGVTRPRPFALEPLDLLAEHEATAAQHPVEAGAELRRQRGVLAIERGERDPLRRLRGHGRHRERHSRERVPLPVGPQGATRSVDGSGSERRS